MGALRLVELQRTGERLEDGVGDTARVAALEPRVVVDADAGEERDLLPAQARDAACTAEDGQARLLRGDLGAPRGQELAELGLRVHASRVTPPARGERPCQYLDQQGRSRGRALRASVSRGHRFLTDVEREARHMRATVMYGAGDVRIENVPDARLVEPTDALVRVTRACICGSDLWPYNQLEPSESGQRMGHEFIGVVEDVGADVRTVKAGDLVVAPFAWSDGTCVFCHEGLHTSCLHGGFWAQRRHRRRSGRGGARPARRRNARRPPGRRGRRADAVAADALGRDGHRPPRGASRRSVDAGQDASPSSATARSGCAA